ncbi:MAG TPA: hypothetical protein VNH17_16660, partial [Streptosporangiaceae bacterium]|nr:hypothetical protein [Streptosporangiaceae bacterium]
PDTRGFRAKADADIKRALTGLHPVIPLGVDVDAGLRAMRTLQTRVRQLGLADFLDINIPQGRLAAQMSLIRRLLNNAKISDLLEVNLDRSKLTSQLSELKSITATIPIGFDVAKLPKLGPTEPIRVPVTFDTSQLPKLGPVGDLTGNIDVSKIKSASTALAGVAAAEKLVADSELKAADGARTQSLQTALAAARLTDMGTALRKLDGQLKDTVGITAELTAADALLGGQAARLAQNYTSLARAQALGARAAQDLAVATTAAAGGSGGKGGLAGLAAAAAAGGANFGRFRGFLGGAIGGVSLFHIALDLVVEGFIALTLAALAAAPAIAVMVNVSKDISTHLQAVHAVTESLGQDIPPLTGKFDALAHAMAPQVIEAYGGALNLIDSQTSLFGQAVERVLPVFNTWIAKIDLFAQSQQFGKFISSGIGYLNQFAGILGTVGQALTNLLNKDPGIARFLLDAIQGLATLLKLFTDLPAPVVTAVLALHGLYLWARVMGGILISLAGYFTKVGLGIAGLVGPMLGLTEATGPFAKTILGLSAVSWGWIGLAAAGLGILAYEFFQASNGAKDFIARLEQGLTDTGIQNDMAAISGQIGNLNTEMSLASAKTGELVSGLNSSVAKSAGFFSQVLKDAPLSNKEFTDLAKGIWEGAKALAGFQSAGLSMRQNNNDIKLYRDEITKLLGAQDALFNETGLLVTQGHTWDQALALEAIAGVQWNDTADVMRQKVDNLVKGYQNMSVQGGILNNSVNAVTFATLQQQSKIKDLTDGWSAFLKLVTGGASSFITFEQQVIGIAGAAAGAADTLNISNGRVSASTRGVGAAAAGASTSITGLSSDSLQLRATFLQGVTDASNLQNSLLDLASASGLGAKGNDLLTQASKDAVAQLLPMAKGSTELTTTLYALAQQGGYQGADSFKELSKWVDTASGTMHTAKDPAKQLDDI